MSLLLKSEIQKDQGGGFPQQGAQTVKEGKNSKAEHHMKHMKTNHHQNGILFVVLYVGSVKGTPKGLLHHKANINNVMQHGKHPISRPMLNYQRSHIGSSLQGHKFCTPATTSERNHIGFISKRIKLKPITDFPHKMEQDTSKHTKYTINSSKGENFKKLQ